MKLELANFPVKRVQFGKQTSYKDGVLQINKDELIEFVLEDKRIASANLDVAFPNEQTRIVIVRDAVEPRVKVSGPSSVFPGILGPAETVGEGRTNRLSRVAVVTSAKYCPRLLAGTTSQRSGVLDMWGPGSLVTPLGSTINIVLILKLVEGVTEWGAHAAIQLAECRVANRLAETTRSQTCKNLEVFELFKVDPSLPRVVYILCCSTEPHAPHSGVALYGLPIQESLPTFIHPNEFLDGALTTDARRGSALWTDTWGWMNHPVVLGLLREHGKRLNFLGVILQRTEFETQLGKQVTAACTSQMARLLGADGALLTRIIPSGNNVLDVMGTLQACERKSVKTVLITPEQRGADTEPSLPFYLPEATAMVSTGDMYSDIKLPAPTKVIGAEKGELVELWGGETPFSPWDEITLSGLDIDEGVDWWGGGYKTCKEY